MTVMKKFRPYKPGYIVLYALCVLCVSDAVWSMIAPSLGRGNEYMQSFSMFSYLIAILAVVYVKMYITTRIEIDDKVLHFVNPVYIKPQPGAKRASFVFRQGENDIKKIDKKVPLMELEKYGYIEDLGYSQLDNSGVGETNKLFPVHEIALVMKDGKRYHFNGGNYSVKQLKEINALIEKATGLKPEGKLANPTKPVKAAKGKK
jgi:hypothetical protein